MQEDLTKYCKDVAIETTLIDIHSDNVHMSVGDDHTYCSWKFHQDSLSILSVTVNYVWRLLYMNEKVVPAGGDRHRAPDEKPLEFSAFYLSIFPGSILFACLFGHSIILLSFFQWRTENFPDGRGTNPGVGANLLLGNMFDENCMKNERNWTNGVHPYRLPWIRHHGYLLQLLLPP